MKYVNTHGAASASLWPLLTKYDLIFASALSVNSPGFLSAKCWVLARSEKRAWPKTWLDPLLPQDSSEPDLCRRRLPLRFGR